MINRVLIRVKVVQTLYAHSVSQGDRTVIASKNELRNSLDKSHELYHSLLQLIVDLTKLQESRIDEARNKLFPTQDDLNPNMRFVENQLVARLVQYQDFADYVEEHKITWQDDQLFLRLMLDKVLKSEEYQEYMAMPATDFASDCQVWQQLLKKVILPDDDLLEHLENQSVYWSEEDLDIMGQFALKTIRRIEEGSANAISPEYKDSEDSLFGEQLLVATINGMEEINKLIDANVRSERWEADRLALMDRLVMCACLSEILNFPNIPVNVSLNEYIELAKRFSTARSGQFINGIMHAIVGQLRSEGKLVKS